MSLRDDSFVDFFSSPYRKKELQNPDSFHESFSNPDVSKDIRQARQSTAMERLQIGAESLLSPRDYGPGDFVVWKSSALKTHRAPGLDQPAYVLEVTKETPEYVERREDSKDLSGSIYQALKLNVRVLVELDTGLFAEFWLPGDRLCRFFSGDLKKFADENSLN